MAVEAQLACNAFSQEFRSRAHPQRIRDVDDVLFPPEVLNHLQIPLDHDANGRGGGGGVVFPNVATALSVDHPKSDLTCNNNNNNNGSASTRKRARHPSSMPIPADLIGVQETAINPLHNLRYPTAVLHAGTVMPNLPLQSRLYGSAGTSTSGRPSVTAPAATFSQDLAALFCQESLEVEALVRLQTERLRSGLEQVSKRQCRALVSAVEQQVSQRLRDKEFELESVSRRNMELEEKVRSLSVENQIWFDLAKNSEAMASSLRNALEQAVLQNATVATAAAPAEEGYGDSDDVRCQADDAWSCCLEDMKAVEERSGTNNKGKRVRRDEEKLGVCKVCLESEACVLLLPCRHLCLCKECEPILDACPICCSTKTASLQIFLS